MDRYEEALESYDQAIKNNPSSSHFYANKAAALLNEQIRKRILKMSRFEEALQMYNQAIQQNPEISTHFFNKAVTLLNL